MGGRGAGFSNASKNSKSRVRSLERISIDGKTGTEKQRAYAESLLEDLRNTAISNSTPGYSTNDGSKIRHYTSSEDDEAMRAAYRLTSESVKNRRTYGEVINLLTNKSIIELKNEIKTASKNKNKSASEFVEEIIASQKRREK